MIQLCVREDGTPFFFKSYAIVNNPLLNNEVKIYQNLKHPHLHGFPEIREAFSDQGRVYLVVEQLGLDIEVLRKKCGGRLTLKTVLLLALQMLDRV